MADFTMQQRRDMAASGMAMRDGSFPIRNRGDVQAAIDAVGMVRPDTEEARAMVRRFIMRRCAALGVMDMIPDNWNADGTLKSA